MRPRISIRGCVRPSVGPSVGLSEKKSKGRIYLLTKLVFSSFSLQRGRLSYRLRTVPSWSGSTKLRETLHNFWKPRLEVK